MQYQYAVFIGRMQPPNKGHINAINKGLEIAENVIIVLGSSYSARTIKNPWPYLEREEMIKSAVSDPNRLQFIYLRDYLYNDNLWLANIQQKIATLCGVKKDDKVALIGHMKDQSSYYLKMFPQWDFVDTKFDGKLRNATDVRNLYFTGSPDYKKDLYPSVASYLEKFKNTELFKDLCSEFEYIQNYKKSWAVAPYPPTFLTVDAVVVSQGHILLVKRKFNPGKGLWALPGGFVNQDEALEDSVVRELKEETGIKIPKNILNSAISDRFVADHPERSLRGRTVSHAFLFDLKGIQLEMGELPEVKGSDDAEHVFWLPVGEVMPNSDKFFEDHCDIIMTLCYRI